MAFLYGRAGRLTAKNGGFRSGQSDGCYGVTIGGNAWDPNSWPFNGQMDEVCRRPPCAPGCNFLVSLCAPPPQVAYWDIALSDEDVQTLYNDGAALDMSP